MCLLLPVYVSDANSYSLMGSLMQLLEVLYAFHFIVGKCLQPLLTSISSLFFSLHLTLFSLFVLSVILSLVSLIMEWLSSLVHGM